VADVTILTELSALIIDNITGHNRQFSNITYEAEEEEEDKTEDENSTKMCHINWSHIFHFLPLKYGV
jgi:hypothetical protein